MRRSDGPKRNRGSGTASHWIGTIAVSLVLVAGVAAELGVLPSLSQREAQPPRVAEPPRPSAKVQPPEVQSVAPVLTVARAADPIPREALERLLRGSVDSRALGDSFALAVEELGASRPLAGFGRSPVVTPASLVKLLTTVAALSVLGPDHRFETSVVTGATKHDLVLVGGGDPLLTGRARQVEGGSTGYPDRASLAQLARTTARRLLDDGVRRVRLSYDASLFSGPAVNPAWRPTYIRYFVVSPITALWVDEGRVHPESDRRVADPSLTAAERFAAMLRSAGVQVAADVVAGRATRSGGQVAAVQSAPLDQIIEHVIAVSDNEAAEVLLRHVALASDRRGSAAAGVEAVRRTLSRLDVDMSRVTLLDGSGLARGNALPVRVLVDVLQLAADPQRPDLRAVVSSLPVAGFTGTLAYRFDQAPRGFGVVRAKTGTLTGVHGYAGLAVTRDGHTLVFAMVADQVPERRTLAARARLDHIAALLTTYR